MRADLADRILPNLFFFILADYLEVMSNTCAYETKVNNKILVHKVMS